LQGGLKGQIMQEREKGNGTGGITICTVLGSDRRSDCKAFKNG